MGIAKTASLDRCMYSFEFWSWLSSPIGGKCLRKIKLMFLTAGHDGVYFRQRMFLRLFFDFLAIRQKAPNDYRAGSRSYHRNCSFQIQHQENCLWKRIQDEDNFDFHVLWPISFQIIQFSRRNVKKFLKKMIFFFNKCLPKLPAILIAERWGSRRHIRLGTINCLKFSSATGDTKFSFVFFSEITSLPCLHTLFPNVLHSPVNAH